MIALQLQLVNIDELRERHDAFLAAHETMLAETTTSVGERAVEYARSHPRFTPRSGNLQRKTEWRSIRTTSGRILRLQNDAKYAAAIDRGARPHDISANKKPYLHFRGKQGWVRTKRVKHPGNKPYRFLYGATLVANKLLGIELERGMRRLASRF